MTAQYVKRKASQFTGIDSLHKLICLFCIIATEMKEKFEQNEWKVMELAFLLWHQIRIHVKEGKNCSDFFHSQFKYREFSIH